ncbi:MAG: citryl-CoA lyase [Betaproteobacteria bacterium]|nr:citryl-CoA lyase [Betaproteobacteria bacterium]
MSQPPPTTAICHATPEAIFVRGANLVDELIGQVSFTEMILFQMLGQRPTRTQTVLLDAVLVTLMEHGLTPSAIATRLIYDSAPEALQSAVAAGVLGVGSTFIGTMEGCSAMIAEMLEAPEGVPARAAAIADRLRAERKPAHGFGHPHHKPDDPRSPRLFEVALREGVPGRHIAALQTLSREIDRAFGRHLTINATGAIAAVLGEIGIPQPVMRGIAVISRAAGLVGHIWEERQRPSARWIWNTVEHGIAYDGDAA